jgi:uncharacterized protein YfaP (DUF2135 family)
MRLAGRQYSRAARVAGRLGSRCRARHLILFSLAVLWITGSSGDTAARGAPVSWSPTQLAATVEIGAVQTTLVTFTSAIDLSDIAVDIVPALSPYVQASPSHFAHVAAGSPVEVTLTLTAPGGTPPGTVEGTLKLRNAGRPPRTHPLPLPITLTITRDEPGDGLIVSGRVLFDSGGPVAGAIVRGSLVSEEAIEAVQIVRQEQRALADPTTRTSKNGSVFADALAAASPVLPTAVPAETVTAADGSFVIDLGPAAVPVRVRVEVSFQPDSLPRVDVAKWEVALGNALDMGTIVIPDPIGAELPVAGGAAASADGSVKVSGLPPEVNRVFARAFDPDESPEAFPGEFAEMGAIPLNSSLFLWMEALDAQGNAVDDLTQAATIRARVPRSQWIDLEDIDSGTDRIEIPIYFFNESTSMWEQMGIGWLEDDQGMILTETVQPAILGGSFPREIFATFTTMHLSWMNVDYAFIGPWTLSRLDATRRNNDCFFNATQLAKAIVGSALGRAAFAHCTPVPPGGDVGVIFVPAFGPEIRNDDLFEASTFMPVFGMYFGRDEIHLSNLLWNACGPTATEQQKKLATFQMAVTILHETAHWLCSTEGVEQPSGEAGNFIELALFGGKIVQPSLSDLTPFVLDSHGNVEPVESATLDAWLDPASWPAAELENLRNGAISPFQASSSLGVTISLTKSTFELGEEIPVTVTYTNLASAPILLPDFIVLEGNPLWLEIVRDGESRSIPFVGPITRLALDLTQDFVSLAPGASLQQTITVLRDQLGGTLYDVRQSGNYQVTAVFSDLWAPVETRSNTLTFTVGAGGSIAGAVTDATNAQPIAGATVTAILNGAIVGTATTASDGTYTLSNLPTGAYTLEAHGSTYSITRRENVQVVAGQTTIVNFSLSLLLATGQLRLVLTWGEVPGDLDAHLWLPLQTPYHLYFFRKGAADICPFAVLDRDDLNAFGPETITIAQRLEGTYIYAVHRSIFGSQASLAGSGALVQVFDSTGLIASVTVPAEGTGDWWNVLTIDGATGAITIVNAIGDDPEPYPDTNAGCPGGN